MKALALLLAAVALCASHALALNNGLGRTPQMGWNSWNYFGCRVNETIVRATADALISSGLAKLGYIYVNVDDCWAYDRLPNGTIQSDPRSFPSGMAALADYVHSKGLKFGLYSDAGNFTCAGRPGSLGYETIDADTYASWNVDYLKYDNCFAPSNLTPMERYPVMRDALNATGHRIFFSMCEWGVLDPAEWAPSVGNSWRTTEDISDNFESMRSNALLNDEWAAYAAPGGWNDPDMLQVGNGGQTTAQYVMQFSLWCLAKSPLLIGCDIMQLTPTSDDFIILSNTEAIAVNQDPLGVQGRRLLVNGTSEVWAGPLANGDVAVVLVNMATTSASVAVSWSTIGFSHSPGYVRDLWAHKTSGPFAHGYVARNVPAQGAAFLRVSAQPPHAAVVSH